MPRIRTIKPEFWGSHKTARVSRDARLLFLGLLNESDDEGRQLGSPKRIGGAVFPNDDDVTQKLIVRWLDELEQASMIHRYVVDAIAYILIVGFVEHQRVSHPTLSRLPGPSPDSVAISSGAAPEVLVPDLGSGSRNREVEMEIARPRAPRERDVLWDTMLEACAIDPTAITKDARGAYNRAAAELRGVKAQPAEILSRAAIYREKWPGTSCTPTALARHWAECVPEQQPIVESDGIRNIRQLQRLREKGTA